MKEAASCPYIVFRAAVAAGAILSVFHNAFADIPASAYIQDGLIAQWDGIDNAGTGTHDPNATTWKELKGDLATVATALTFRDGKSAYFNGTSGSGTLITGSFPAALEAIRGGAFMAEVYFKPLAYTQYAGIFHFGVNGTERYFSLSSDLNAAGGKGSVIGAFQYKRDSWNAANCYSGAIASLDECHHVGCIANGRNHTIVVDGETISTHSAGTLDNYGSTNFQIGKYANNNPRQKMDLFGIRLYNRVLSADEIACNANIDKIRFDGADPEALTWPEGWQFEDGSLFKNVKIRVRCGSGEDGYGKGGTISISGGEALTGTNIWHECNSTMSLRLSATPAEGYEFVGWSGISGEGTYEAEIETVIYEDVTAVFKVVGETYPREYTWVGASGGVWDDPGSWEDADGFTGVPAAGDSVTISGGASVTLTNATPVFESFTITGEGTTLTMSEAVRAAPGNCVTVLRADAVTLADGAVITHVINAQTAAEYNAVGEWQLDGRVNIECGTLDIDAESAVNANAKGYYTRPSTENNGPGGIKGGAGHGGFSAAAYLDIATGRVIGGSYGDMERPLYPGSSSFHGDKYNNDICGGGVVKITASGIVTLEGSVTSDAGSCGGASRHGCSGGSVWLTCKAIRGSGKISADGARNTINSGQVNVGAGGRVALHYDADAQTALDMQEGAVPAIRFSVNSPSSRNAGTAAHSSADIGTVWCTDARFYGEEYNTERGVAYGEINAGDWSLWNPQRLKLVNAWIRIPSPQLAGRTFESVDISGCNGQLDLGGEAGFVYCQRGFGSGTSMFNSFPNSTRVYNSKARPKVTVTGNVTLSDYGFLRLSTKATNETETAEWTELRVKGDIELGNWSWIETPCDPTNGAACRIWANNLVIAKNAGIRSDARGFGGCDGRTREQGYGPGATHYGAAHGGAGNYALPYGDCRLPVLPGSGGLRGDQIKYNGSAGGGVVWITLEGNCVLDGGLQANAGDNVGYSSNTGSGGSVLLVCTNGTLSGSGYIEANGGRSQFSYGHLKHGAGGRIAVHYDRELQAELPPPSISVSAMAVDKPTTFLKSDIMDFGTFYAQDTALLEGIFAPKSVKRALQLYLDDWSGFGDSGLVISNLQVRLVNAPQSLEIKGDVKIYAGALEFGGDAYNDWHNMFRYTSQRRGMDVTILGDTELFCQPMSGYTNTSYICHYGGITNGNTGVITSKYDKANKDVVVSGSIVFKGDVRLNENTYIHPYSHPFHGGTAKLVFKNLDIAVSAAISANEAGWTSGRRTYSDSGMGPGAGRGGATAASYGGRGASGMSVYGCEKLPTLPGSGSGSAYYDTTETGNGGGLLYIEVSKCFNLAGGLTANSKTTGGGTYSSGGSGGGIYVSAKTMDIADTAVISANGGNGNGKDGAVGGGGRIAIYTDHRAVNENTIAITPTVNPGTYGKRTTDETGTIYYGARPSDGFMLILR